MAWGEELGIGSGAFFGLQGQGCRRRRRRCRRRKAHLAAEKHLRCHKTFPMQGLHPPGWADLPPELLHLIVTAAQRELCTPPCGPPAGSHVPRHGQPPSLAQAAALRAAVECCCRGWRAGMRVQAAPPLHLALGRSAMTAGERAAPLCRWLARLPAATLRFGASQLPGCGSGAMLQLALDVVGSEELRAASGKQGVVRNRQQGRALAWCPAGPLVGSANQMAPSFAQPSCHVPSPPCSHHPHRARGMGLPLQSAAVRAAPTLCRAAVAGPHRVPNRSGCVAGGEWGLRPCASDLGQGESFEERVCGASAPARAVHRSGPQPCPALSSGRLQTWSP